MTFNWHPAFHDVPHTKLLLFCTFCDVTQLPSWIDDIQQRKEFVRKQLEKPVKKQVPHRKKTDQRQGRKENGPTTCRLPLRSRLRGLENRQDLPQHSPYPLHLWKKMSRRPANACGWMPSERRKPNAKKKLMRSADGPKLSWTQRREVDAESKIKTVVIAGTVLSCIAVKRCFDELSIFPRERRKTYETYVKEKKKAGERPGAGNLLRNLVLNQTRALQEVRYYQRGTNNLIPVSRMYK